MPIQTTPAGTPAATATEQLCRQMLPGATLLAWASGTVAGFRAWQHGGPVPIRPLKDAFPGVPATATGAWCGIWQDVETIRWLAVVAGRDPAHLIDITGQGETAWRGDVGLPPVVP